MADADEKLRAKAEAATTGPWYLDGDAESEGHLFVGNRADGRAAGLWEIVHMSAEKMGRGNLGELTLAARSRRVADAAFIAAANPVVVLSLLDRLAAVEAELAEAKRSEAQAWEKHAEMETDAMERSHVSHEACQRNEALEFAAEARDVEITELRAERDQALQALQRVTTAVEQLRMDTTLHHSWPIQLFAHVEKLRLAAALAGPVGEES